MRCGGIAGLRESPAAHSTPHKRNSKKTFYVNNLMRPWQTSNRAFSVGGARGFSANSPGRMPAVIAGMIDADPVAGRVTEECFSP